MGLCVIVDVWMICIVRGMRIVEFVRGTVRNGIWLGVGA